METKAPSVHHFFKLAGYPGPFKPCFSHHVRIDMAILTLKDCTSTTHRITDWLDLHYGNHGRLKGRVVGMAIQWPAKFLRKFEFSLPRRMMLKVLVRHVLAYDPQAFGKKKHVVERLVARYGNLSTTIKLD